MFGSNILDTAIGLVLVFLIMSLICTALREIIESVLKQRAVDLEHGMRELLQDPSGEGLVKELYSHPLIYGLFSGNYLPKGHGVLARWFGLGGKLPSYIPKDNFARALIDLQQQGKVQSPAVQAALRALGQEAGNDIAQLRTNVENWFDTCSDRITGWYKRRTQAILLALGFIMAFALNVNTITIANRLYTQSSLRAAVEATAERFVAGGQGAVADTSTVRASVNALESLAQAGLPMGKNGVSYKTDFWLALFGWLLTAAAVTLGAPFWFDTLNKFISVRSTIKPNAPPPPPPSAPSSTDAVVPARQFAVAVNTRQVGDGDVVTAGVAITPQPVADASIADDYTPHEWRDSNHEEGIL